MNIAASTELDRLTKSNIALTEEVTLLRQQIKALKHLLYGAKSEKLRAELLGQLALFEELEKSQAPEPKKRVVESHERSAPKRRPFPEDLVEREVHHDLSPEEKVCGCCQSALTHIGTSTSKKLNYIPATLELEKHIQHKYTCKTCDGVDNEGTNSVVCKPMPKSILPKSYATAALLAYIVVSKYEDAMPLYRLEKSFSRLKVSISRKTMTDWVLKLSEKLTCLHKLLLKKVKEAPWVGADETRMELTLRSGKARSGKKGRFRGQMWVVHCQLPKPAVVFMYKDGRGQAEAIDLLKGYEGVVMTDDLHAYKFMDGKKPPWPGIRRAACLVHARRKFIELLPDVRAPLMRSTLTGRVLYRFNLLYKLEKLAKSWEPAKRHEMRQTKSRKLLENLKRDLKRSLEYGDRAPAGKLKDAIDYMLRSWTALTIFLEDPHYPLDNNSTENKIRPYVVGRKNWLHASSRQGAEANGIMYSLISTAQANKLNTYDYLMNLFERLPYATTDSDLEVLLPIK